MRATSTKRAVLLAIGSPLAVVVWYWSLVLSEAYPREWLVPLMVGVPVVALLLALGSLIFAATSLRSGVRVGRLVILTTALIETLWTALFVSDSVNSWVCNQPFTCLITVRPPGF